MGWRIVLNDKLKLKFVTFQQIINAVDDVDMVTLTGLAQCTQTSGPTDGDRNTPLTNHHHHHHLKFKYVGNLKFEGELVTEWCIDKVITYFSTNLVTNHPFLNNFSLDIFFPSQHSDIFSACGFCYKKLSGNNCTDEEIK